MGMDGGVCGCFCLLGFHFVANVQWPMLRLIDDGDVTGCQPCEHPRLKKK